MIQNEHVWRQFRPDLEHPTRDDVVEIYRSTHTLPVPWIEGEAKDGIDAATGAECDGGPSANPQDGTDDGAEEGSETAGK